MEIISACYSGRQCGGRDYLCLLLCCCGPTVISPPQPLSLLMVLILPKSFGYKSVPVQGLPFDYNKGRHKDAYTAFADCLIILCFYFIQFEPLYSFHVRDNEGYLMI